MGGVTDFLHEKDLTEDLTEPPIGSLYKGGEVDAETSRDSNCCGYGFVCGFKGFIEKISVSDGFFSVQNQPLKQGKKAHKIVDFFLKKKMKRIEPS
jgi:hypothetical protein